MKRTLTSHKFEVQQSLFHKSILYQGTTWTLYNRP